MVFQVQKTGKSDLFCQNFKTDFLAKILTKIERNQGQFFRKSDFILRKARLEISKSEIEKIKSGFQKIKSRFFLEKNSEKIAKNKDFFGKIKA